MSSETKQCPELIKERTITFKLPPATASPGPAGGSPTSTPSRAPFFVDVLRMQSMQIKLNCFPESKMTGEARDQSIETIKQKNDEQGNTWPEEADKNDLANEYLIDNQVLVPQPDRSAFSQFVALAESPLAPYFHQKALTSSVFLEQAFRTYNVDVGEPESTQLSFNYIEHPALSYHSHPKPTLHVTQTNPTEFSLYTNYIIKADILSCGDHTNNESRELITGIKLEFRVHIIFDTKTLQAKMEISIHTDCKVPAVINFLKLTADACYLFHPDKSPEQLVRAISIPDKEKGEKQFLDTKAQLLQHVANQDFTIQVNALKKYISSWSGRRTYAKAVSKFLTSMTKKDENPRAITSPHSPIATTALIAWLIFIPKPGGSASDKPRKALEQKLKDLDVDMSLAFILRAQLHTVRKAILENKTLTSLTKEDIAFIMASPPWQLIDWLDKLPTNSRELNKFIRAQKQILNNCCTNFRDCTSPTTKTAAVYSTARTHTNSLTPSAGAGASAGHAAPPAASP